MFPGATAERADAAYAIVGAPLDVSTTFQPGTRFGPDRIRRFARSFEDYDHRTQLRFSDCAVYDHGDIRAWNDGAEYVEYLGGVLTDFRREGTIPLLLGGEHTVTAAGVRAIDPETVVVIDAHLDLRDAYDDDPWNHACVTRRSLETADEVVILGARAGSEDEWKRAECDDVTVVPPSEVADWSPPDRLADRSTYLSVDVDGADPGVAPGTGTMEPFGLSSREMRDAVRAVAPLADGFDVVEVNDRDDGQAAALAGKLLRTFVYEHAATGDRTTDETPTED